MKGERLVGGLRCGQVLAELEAYLSGSLAPERERAVVAHVSGCELCARFGGTYAEAVRGLRRAAREPDPPPSVLARLREKLGAG